MSTTMRLIKAFNALGSELCELVQSWWQVDRIRISSDAGRLLRIPCPSLISIRGQPVEVQTRMVCQETAGARITYECHTSSGTAWLCIEVLPSATRRLFWRESGYENLLSEDEIEIWR